MNPTAMIQVLGPGGDRGSRLPAGSRHHVAGSTSGKSGVPPDIPDRVGLARCRSATGRSPRLRARHQGEQRQVERDGAIVTLSAIGESTWSANSCSKRVTYAGGRDPRAPDAATTYSSSRPRRSGSRVRCAPLRWPAPHGCPVDVADHVTAPDAPGRRRRRRTSEENDCAVHGHGCPDHPGQTVPVRHHKLRDNRRDGHQRPVTT